MKLLRSQYLLTLLTGLLLVTPHITFAAGTILQSLNEAAQNLVFNIVMGILGMFVWLAALLLNFSVNNFIIGFGNTFANTGIGIAVDNVWVIVRDFVNLTFIFGFIYIGFKMILNSSDSNTRRWLVNIILAALLVNFSLFVTKFAIDMSNQLAAQIAISGLGSTSTEVVNGLRQVDIASEFMARMGLSKVFSLTWENINGAGWGYIFGTAMLSLTAMFVFAAGGILIIIRFAVLCLFMVLSPVMFMSWILPPLKDTFDRFWSMFIGRALFAPIYLLFIYFSLQIISGLQVSVGGQTNGFGNPDWAGTFQGAGKLDTQGNAVLTLGTFPFFILAAIFMAASVVIANKLGADGGAKAVGLGKTFERKVRGAVGSGTLGLAGVAGQQTLGRYARGRANDEDLQRRAAEGSYRARMQLAAARRVADSSFDARRVGGVGKALGIGEGQKGGIETRIKDKQKKEEEFMKSLKTDISIKDSEKIKKEEEEKLEKENQETDKELETIEAVAENSGKNTVALTNEINDLGKDIEGLSTSLAAKVSAGTITTSEREAEERKIADLTTIQRKKTLARDERKAQLEIQAQIRKNSASAASATDPVEAARFREEAQRLESELNKKLDYSQRKKVASDKSAVLSDPSKRAAIAAGKAAERENEIKYKNQMAYMDTMRRRAERSWDPRVTEESLENLQKKFGRTREEMAKKDKENKAKGDLAKQLKELQDAETKGSAPATPPPAGDAH